MSRRVLFGALLSILVLPVVAFAASTKIVGGAPAVPGAWPFMAAILDSSGSPTSQYCGGSLIASKWVVSAAHCFVENGSTTPASSVRVGLGLYQLSAGGGSILSVKRIIVHPQYNANTNDFDMALLELNGTATQAPIAINTGSADIAGIVATAIGWGLTDPNDNNSSSDILRQVNLPIVSNTTCNVPYGGGITARMVCAGYSQGGKDTCQGDSGGPLVATIGGQLKLVGVTSFGEGCAAPNIYGVYSRVTAFETFIRQYVTIADPTPTNGKYGLWNGYLSMTNIIELINRSNQDVTAQVNMISGTGALISSSFFRVGASSQQDVILNQLPGFASDSYGLVQVSNNIDGRVFFYRATDPSFTHFEFAFGLPLQNAITGTTAVAFNTYNPTFNPSEIGNPVANWLSIVNLSTAAQSYTVKKYNIAGALIATTVVTVSAKSRFDVEGGHLNPGPANLGLIEVMPANSAAPYIAELMRYGSGPNGSFDFAFPLFAKSGSAAPLAVELGSSALAQNWLEVINAGTSTNSILVSFYNQGGALVAIRSLQLNGRSQHHINVNEILGDQAVGYARVASQNGQPVIAESMLYYRHPLSGSITAMYGAQAGAAVSGSVRGSYNLYIGMEDYLRISNPNDVAVEVDITILSASSVGSSRTVTLPANSTAEFALADSALFGTVPNSYGTVVVTPRDSSKALIHGVLRAKHDPTGDLEFTAPTALE